VLAGKARTCCSESNSMMAANSTSGATATWRTPAAYRFAPSTPTARPRCTRCCAARPATTSPPCARSSHAPAPARPAWTPTGDTAGPAGNRQQRPPLADLAGKRAARHEQLPLGRCCADPWSGVLGPAVRDRRLPALPPLGQSAEPSVQQASRPDAAQPPPSQKLGQRSHRLGQGFWEVAFLRDRVANPGVAGTGPACQGRDREDARRQATPRRPARSPTTCRHCRGLCRNGEECRSLWF
jgi:hypothetical protein